MAEKLEFDLVVVKNSLRDALNEIEKQTKKTEASLSGFQKLFKDIGVEAQRVKESFIGNFGASVVSKSLSVIGSGFASVVNETREFSRAIAEINSTLPKTQRLTESQSIALAKLSERFGTSATAQAKGFFEVVSNGVEDAATAFGILQNANNAALSGLVDVNTATQVITTTFNAYKNQGIDAAKVTDTLVAVTQLSGAKFEDLANTLGRVTNVAAQSGVSIDELGGTVAFLNARSLTTEQAVTGLAGAISDISKPTADAQKEAARLGIEFNATALKSKGLVGFLQEVAEKTNGNITALRRLFADQRSANAVIAIASGNFSEYAATIEKVTNSQGEASRAAKTIKESLDFKLDNLVNSFNSLAITLGTKLTPAIDLFSDGLKAFRELLGDSNLNIDTNVTKLKELGKEYNSNSEKIKSLQSDLELYNFLGNDTSVAINQEKINKLLERQVAITKERNAIRSQPAQQDQVLPAQDAGLDQAVIDSRLETFRALTQARIDFNIADQQIKLNNELLEDEQRAIEFEKLLAFERQKIDAKFAAEEEKNQLILDSVTKEQAIRATAFKKETELANKKDQIEKQRFLAQNKLEQQSLNTRLGYIQAFGNLAAAATKDGSKAQFLAQKGAAIAGSIVATQLAAAQALATPPAPNLPLAATARTIGGINTAAIIATAIKGFADGGIIGGNVGATNGGDNRLAKVRDGEMVLNATQQENLFNAIDSGNIGGNIIIQIDGREIAKVVRNQVRSGFVLA